MSFVKRIFEILFENKITVVKDCVEINAIRAENNREMSEQSKKLKRNNILSRKTTVACNVKNKRLDSPTNQREEQKASSRLYCWFCLVPYSNLLIFKCEQCQQDYCERCKWQMHNCTVCGYDLSNTSYRDYCREKKARQANKDLNHEF